MLSERIHGAVSIHTVVRKDIHTMKHLNIISEIIDKVNPLVGKTANKLIVPQKLAFFVGIDPVITVRRSGGVRNQVPKRGPPAATRREIFQQPRFAIHAAKSDSDSLPFRRRPSTISAVGEMLPLSFSIVLPKPLPPEVANKTIFFPEKS